MEERGRNQLSLYLIFFLFSFFLKLATALVPLYMREGEGIVDACH